LDTVLIVHITITEQSMECNASVPLMSMTFDVFHSDFIKFQIIKSHTKRPSHGAREMNDDDVRHSWMIEFSNNH
jgi:hypothetical protein